jgi:hypothetical protein
MPEVECAGIQAIDCFVNIVMLVFVILIAWQVHTFCRSSRK